MFQDMKAKAEADMQDPNQGPATAETTMGANSRDLNFTDALLQGAESAPPLPNYAQYYGAWAVDMLKNVGWGAGEPIGQDHGHPKVTEPVVSSGRLPLRL